MRACVIRSIYTDTTSVRYNVAGIRIDWRAGVHKPWIFSRSTRECVCVSVLSDFWLRTNERQTLCMRAKERARSTAKLASE